MKSLATNAKVGSRKEELKRIRKPGSQEKLLIVTRNGHELTRMLDAVCIYNVKPIYRSLEF